MGEIVRAFRAFPIDARTVLTEYRGVKVSLRAVVMLLGLVLVGGSLLRSTPAAAQAPRTAQLTTTATFTATPTATVTPTATPPATVTTTTTGTITPTATVTPTITLTPAPAPTQVPTATAAPTATPAGGITVSISPSSTRIRAGETVAINVKIDWNPTNAAVVFTQSAGDALSAPLITNSQWSPSSTVTGTNSTQLVLGTSANLAPGVYTVQISGAGPLGANVQKATIEVSIPNAMFDSELLRRNEFPAFGPEVNPPYRGGDSYFYDPRVNALLQWRPDQKTYYVANTSELLDQSVVGPAQYRLPAPVADDGSGGDWNKAAQIRQDWMTDRAIRAKFFAAPPNFNGTWDVNGSIQLYGLPASKPTQIGPYVVQRFQRAVFRHWIANTPAHPDWKDSVAIVPLEQAVLNLMPEIDPIASAGIVRATRNGQPSGFGGYWELDASSSNGFASAALEGDDANTARVTIANPTGMWIEASLVGPIGMQAELGAGQSVVSDWPGLQPLSWILEPGQKMTVNIHPNLVHPDATVRQTSVMHIWMRPTSRSAMAKIAQSMASVGLPELTDLHGARLTAYYRALLASTAQAGAGNAGCLIALDGDVNAGDEAQFSNDLACAVTQPVTGYLMATAAAAIGTGVDPNVVSSRLNVNSANAAIGDDPATGWFWWNLQLAGREPGGRVRISKTGAASGG